MLYECWLAVVAECGAETALWDPEGARCWTFRELARAEEALEVPGDPLVFPQGQSVEFLLRVLQGWHHGQVVCPLEPLQSTPQVPRPPQEIVHLKLTSATTGAARFVGFRAEQLVADVENIRTTMGLRPEWPNLGVISLAHSYGFSNLVLPLLLQGIPLVLCSSGLPEVVRRAAGTIGSLALPAVPALWRAWHEAGVIPANVRLAVSAGAPLPLPVEHEVLRDHGLKVHNFYGATECGGIAYDRAEKPRDDPQLAGVPLEGVTVGVQEDGCLEVRGPNVGTGYWPEADERLGGGRYRTTDLAEVKGGQVYLRGRSGDVIHVAGRKVMPEAVERVLRGHPAVRECLVLGLPGRDDVRQEVVAAVVVVQGRPDAVALREHVGAHLPAWQVPREWRFVESLEANERGKVSRVAWRERFGV